MSEVYAPPPPPPAVPPAPTGYDFLRPFVFLFDDPRWLPKVLIGGAFFLLATMVIGIPFLLGYFAKLTRNVIAGDPRPLPEWVELGELFSEGLLLLCAGVIYLLPVAILSTLIAIPAAITGASDHEGVRDVGGAVFGCASCIVSMLSFAVTLFLPAAILMVITTRQLGAAFDFKRIWAFISANIGNYVLALLAQIIASMLSFAGIMLLCIGIIFTQFWASLVTAYAFGQVYRASPVK